MVKERLLAVHDLKTYYYTRKGIMKAVDGVSLNIGKKEVVGLVGESGCGKTTVGLSIVRLIGPPGRVAGGVVSLKGENLLELPEDEMRSIRGKEISMIFQDPMTYLNPLMRIKAQIAEVLLSHKRTRPDGDIGDIVVNALEMVSIPSPSRVAEYYPHQLSGGMRQRVMIAMALSCHPSLVIADEPTTALDVTTQNQILDILKDAIKTFETSMLLITHDLGIVSEICDRVYVMYAGKIVEDADVTTIFENPKHPYTKGLLDSVLSIDEFKSTLVGIDGEVPSLGNLPTGCRFHPRCKQAMTICSLEEPPPLEVDNSTVACWLFKER